MFGTQFCKNQSRPSKSRRIWIFVFFLSWHHILKIRCIHEAPSVRKPKSSNLLLQRYDCVKSVRKQYGNLDSHPFFLNPILKLFTLFMWCGVWISCLNIPATNWSGERSFSTLKRVKSYVQAKMSYTERKNLIESKRS